MNMGKFKVEDEVTAFHWTETWTVLHGPFLSWETREGTGALYYVIKKDGEDKHIWVEEVYLTLAPVTWTKRQVAKLQEVQADSENDNSYDGCCTAWVKFIQGVEAGA